MNRIVLSTTLVLAAATPLALSGADASENLNRLSLGARLGFNFKADFQNNAPVNPGPAIPGADHTYNDGYVRLDSSGNAGGLTWNWGYQNADQVVGDTLQFTATESTSGSAGNGEVTDDPQVGVELTYQRVMGRLGSGDTARWGLEAGFGYTDLDLRDDRSATGPVTVITDSFALNGVIPPGAGYNGTFQGPGPLLNDTPTRFTTDGIATVTSRQELSGELFAIRLGPFAEWSVTPQLSLAGSVGLTLAPASVDYDLSETTTVEGGSTATMRGHASTTELLYGAYASAMLHYDFNKCLGIYGGAQLQSLTELKQSIGSHVARLDQDITVYGVVGVSWRF